MAKKRAGRAKRRRGSALDKRKFSVKALNRELDKVLKRLGSRKTASARAFRATIQRMRADTDCPRTMDFDLSE